MAELTTLARPYAKAAFEHAQAHQQLANWSAMLGLAAAVSQDDTMQRLLKALPDMPADTGQLQLAQQFGSSPAQVLLQRGEAGNAAPLNLASGNPNWKLSFTPGPALTAALYPPALLGCAALLALAGALLGVYLAQSALQRRLRQDAQAIGQYLQELGGQRTAKAPEVGLAALQPLAQALARQPRRKAEPPAGGR